MLDFFLCLALPGQFRSVGGHQASQFLFLALSLGSQIIGPVLLLETPTA